MPTLLPDADADTGTFINESGGLVLHPSLADASDATFARSPNNPQGSTFRVALSDPGGLPTLPAFVRYRLKKDVSASQVVNATARVLQGSTTIIAEWEHLALTASFVEFEQQLTTEQFQAIADFNDLFLAFEFGIIFDTIAAILTVGEAGDVLVATATVPLTGAVAVTEANDTSAITIALQLLASVIATEANDSIVATADFQIVLPPADLTFLGSGDAKTGNNIALTPLLPSTDHFNIDGVIDDMPFLLEATVVPEPDSTPIEGDFLLAFHTQRSSIATSITAPPGWTHVPGSPYPHATAPLVAAIVRKMATGGDADPEFTIAAGVTGTPTIAQAAVFRGIDAGLPINITSFYQSTAQQNDIGPIPGVAVRAGDIVVVWGLKGGDWINVPDLTGNGLTFTEIGEPSVVLDVSGGFVWAWAKATVAVTVTAKTFQPSGGVQQVGNSIGGMFVLRKATAQTTIFATLSKTEAGDTLVAVGVI